MRHQIVVFRCKTKSLETSRPRRGNWRGPAKGPTSNLRQSSKLSQKQTYPFMKRQGKHIICFVSPWKKKLSRSFLKWMNTTWGLYSFYITLMTLMTFNKPFHFQIKWVDYLIVFLLLPRFYNFLFSREEKLARRPSDFWDSISEDEVNRGTAANPSGGVI